MINNNLDAEAAKNSVYTLDLMVLALENGLHSTVEDLSQAAGIDQSELEDILAGDGNELISTITRVLGAAGYKLILRAVPDGAGTAKPLTSMWDIDSTAETEESDGMRTYCKAEGSAISSFGVSPCNIEVRTDAPRESYIYFKAPHSDSRPVFSKTQFFSKAQYNYSIDKSSIGV